MIGVPLALIILFIVYKTKMANPSPDDEYSSLVASAPPAVNANVRDQSAAQLQQEDPNFSMPLFQDFCQLLYTNITTFAARQQLSKVSTYISEAAATGFSKYWAGAEDIRDIIIGSCTVTGIYLGAAEENSIRLAMETNYTMKPMGGKKAVTFYESSSWTLSRKKGVKSKGPGEINRFGCPSCGGALDDNPEGKCPYCGSPMEKGLTTWYVTAVSIMERSNNGPDVGGYAPEVGTNDPTVFQVGLMEKMALYKQRYPDFTEEGFKQRVKQVFVGLQQAWTDQKWEKARPFETDQLFQVHLYWITHYRRQQVRNVLENIQVQAVEIVKLQHDAFFDAITVRIHAAMIDYTINYAGSYMGGDRKQPRYFTEYWTFIRRGGVKESDKTLDQCPNCGAELNIGMAGKCNYCNNIITTGEFSWILSMIEQDESYTG